MQSSGDMDTLTFMGIPIVFGEALPNDVFELRDLKTGRLLYRMWTGNQDCALMRWEDDGGRSAD